MARNRFHSSDKIGRPHSTFYGAVDGSAYCLFDESYDVTSRCLRCSRTKG